MIIQELLIMDLKTAPVAGPTLMSMLTLLSLLILQLLLFSSPLVLSSVLPHPSSWLS